MNNETSYTDLFLSEAQNRQSAAQKQAALLLYQSLIYTLLGSGALTRQQALAAIKSAA
jgi:hypothetical protein